MPKKPNPKLLPPLRAEYQALFDTLVVRPERREAVEALLDRIKLNRARYEAVGEPLGIPWYFIGAVHSLESSLGFKKHLHNGDPLSGRTVQVPAGRPQTGQPPFTWEASAADALKLKNLHRWLDWSVPGLLYKLEEYNGFGYRKFHPEVKSPYLWSFSTHFTKGKFVKDGVFDPNAPSEQCGAAVILFQLSKLGAIEFQPDDPTPIIEQLSGVVQFDKKSLSAEQLQLALNRVPPISIEVDGVPGRKTSDALNQVTGRFLPGDPLG
jgi:lysozyme family protein